MTSEHTRTVNVSLSNIKDQVASLMYAWGVVDDNDTITNIDLKEALSTDKEEIVQVTVKFKKELEVKGSIKNGSGAPQL